MGETTAHAHSVEYFFSHTRKLKTRKALLGPLIENNPYRLNEIWFGRLSHRLDNHHTFCAWWTFGFCYFSYFQTPRSRIVFGRVNSAGGEIALYSDSRRAGRAQASVLKSPIALKRDAVPEVNYPCSEAVQKQTKKTATGLCFLMLLAVAVCTMQAHYWNQPLA